MYGQSTVDSRNSGGRSVGVGGYDEWLTDRSWEAIELSKFSFVRETQESTRGVCRIYSLNRHTRHRQDSSSTCRTKCTTIPQPSDCQKPPKSQKTHWHKHIIAYLLVCGATGKCTHPRIHASTQMPSGSRSFDTHSVMPNLLCRIFLMHIWMHCMQRSARSPSRRNEYGLKIDCHYARHLPAMLP